MTFRLPRERWLVLAVLGTALAVAVPVAWANFTDVPPSNPFYNDINALQGAGITQGCGGGNFCPNDNITRQADAAFAHRGGARAAFFEGGYVQLGAGGTDLGSVTIDVGGVAGGTQFVILTASVDTEIVDTGGCPCETGYQLTDDNLASVSVDAGYNLNDTVADQGYGDDTGSVQAVVPVSTGGSHTFHVVAFASGGTGTVYAQAQITAMTTPYGNTGGNTLGATSAAGTHRPIPDFSHPGK